MEAEDKDLPVIPPLPSSPKVRPGDPIAICGECGIKIPSGPWGYCCPRNNCPVQPKATMGSGT